MSANNLKRIVNTLELEPYRDGYTHPGEYLLQDLEEVDILQLQLMNLPEGIEADLIRLLGRSNKLLLKNRLDLCHFYSKINNIDIHDAIITAIENWGDKEFLEFLDYFIYFETFENIEDYAKKVKEDLLCHK